MSIGLKCRGIAVSAAVSLLAVSRAFGSYMVNTLVTFDATNGQYPAGGLSLSGSTLFGTTDSGGASDRGTVFSVPVTGGSPIVLVSFNNSNGAAPYAGLTLSGNTLYGTTKEGGAGDDGTVFSVPTTGGAPTTLVTFKGSDGALPQSLLTLAGGNLYGTTVGGGTGLGTVFSVPVTGGAPATLAAFNYTNGGEPEAGVTFSGSTLYGTTSIGGGGIGSGEVFSVPVTGGAPAILTAFNYSNGSQPLGDLILSGNMLYGTTEYGGSSNEGTIFSIPITGGPPTTLANFDRINGEYPHSGLVLSNGILYGATAEGGANNAGTIFSLPVTGGAPTILGSFNNSNGADPQAGLTLSGNTLYGTTLGGGANGDGTVFSLTLAAINVTTNQTYNFQIGGPNGISTTTVAGLAIQAGGEAIVNPAANHANRQLLIITNPGLILAGSMDRWTSLLDLTDNDLDLPGGDLPTVTNQVAQGFNSGSWNGTGGIISSLAGADTGHLTALGVIQNNQSGTAVYTAANPFDGTAPGAGDILVKFTYYGDANLDGKVDGSDYSLIDNGFLNQLTGWYNGDFNYDGVVNASDYTLIDNTYNSQGVALTAQAAYITSEILGQAVAVPEPASVSVLAVGSAAMLQRRRRRGNLIALRE